MTGSTSNGSAAIDWSRVDAALDELIALPLAQRAAAIERIAGGDRTFAAELRSLAEHLDGDDPLLDHPAAYVLGEAAVPSAGLATGTRLGPWCVVALIGRGGMGEVYRAERADGQFEQEVAIKLVRLDAAAHAARFRAERQIVARLDHPGIARLLDGDVSADGRPYMVMELVTGVQLMDWCQANAPTLERRLRLFFDICDAVAYAHRNLIVHRDLKPANVMVTDDGRIKLLDFGIARLTDAPSENVTLELLLTPAYAAPEQLSGGPITTAADVHALGLLLHELLCGRAAYPVQNLPLAAAMQQVITQQARPPSRVALDDAKPPVAPTRLAGDLDAIVAKALRKEPARRYASVDDMRADVERHICHEPVLARRGNWRYVAGRALRRHRALAAGIGLALVVVAAGTTAVAWQARVARDEAARATAVRNFLIEVFRASDPRIASDKPRGQATARELLDAGAGRIEREFKDQTGLEIELLGTVAELYRQLGESDRYEEIQSRRVALAGKFPGQYPQPEIESLLNKADDAQTMLDRATARAHLARADALIHRAGLDASVWRARWWINAGQATEPDQQAERLRAFDAALALFNKHAPRDAGRVTALTERANVVYDFGDYAAAARGNREALAAEREVDTPDDGEAQTIWGNLGQAELHRGRYDDAVAAFKQAASLARQTYGEGHANYWTPASAYARALHLIGRRDDAMAQFDALQKLIPKPPKSKDAWEAISAYAGCLATQGEAARALPLLLAERASVGTGTATPSGGRYLDLALGDIYQQLGRFDEARHALQTSFDGYVAAEAADRQTRMKATERWARFLVDHGGVDTAERLFREVLTQDHDRHLAHAALAQAGLARVALARGQASVALAASAAAMKRWADVRGFRDVRMGAYIARVQARTQLAAGDRQGARTTAETALAESLRYDVPEAASIAEARELLAQSK